MSCRVLLQGWPAQNGRHDLARKRREGAPSPVTVRVAAAGIANRVLLNTHPLARGNYLR